jgi:hypothetical protein
MSVGCTVMTGSNNLPELLPLSRCCVVRARRVVPWHLSPCSLSPAGNIFALRDGRIAYVDFGNVAELSQSNKVGGCGGRLPSLEVLYRHFRPVAGVASNESQCSSPNSPPHHCRTPAAPTHLPFCARLSP